MDRLTPPSLPLLTETLDEERSLDIVYADLARLQRLLKKTPLDNARIITQVKFLVAEWLKLYTSPQPADLEQLISHLQAFTQRLEGGSSSRESAIGKDEDEARSILQCLVAVCSKVSDNLKVANDSRAELVSYREKATALRAKYTSKAAEHEQ